MLKLSWNDVTLGLLSFFTIRQLLAQNLNIPLPPALRWLIYDRKSEAEPVLCRRAYETEKLFADDRTKSSVTEELLELAGRHIKYYEEGLYHNRQGGTKVNSDYFINTLEASYNDMDLGIMTFAIRKLIAESNLQNRIDFILCIKSGNQILARNIYPNDQHIVYVCRLDTESCIRPIRSAKEAHEMSIQYENLDALLNAAKHSAHGNLNGIVVDCSVSSGYGLKTCITEFSELIQKHELKINPIRDAFVLYCHKPNPIPDASFTLHRYFDMDEEIRTLIYQRAGRADSKWPKEVYQKLREKRFLRL